MTKFLRYRGELYRSVDSTKGKFSVKVPGFRYNYLSRQFDTLQEARNYGKEVKKKYPEAPVEIWDDSVKGFYKGYIETVRL